MHCRGERPVGAQLQAAFLNNWVTIIRRVLHGRRCLPPLRSVGTHAAQAFNSSPGGGAESMQLMVLIWIAAARSSLALSMAYFVPDNAAVSSLVAAARRGVRVQIVVPGAYTDREILRRASRFKWGPLLRAVIEIYEYQPTMYHCKVMSVDGLWTSLASTNFDSRSFSVNDEANLNVLDAPSAQAQRQTFDADVRLSRRVTLAEWEGRNWTAKLLDALAGTLGSQL